MPPKATGQALRQQKGKKQMLNTQCVVTTTTIASPIQLLLLEKLREVLGPETIQRRRVAGRQRRHRAKQPRSTQGPARPVTAGQDHDLQATHHEEKRRRVESSAIDAVAPQEPQDHGAENNAEELLSDIVMGVNQVTRRLERGMACKDGDHSVRCVILFDHPHTGAVTGHFPYMCRACETPVPLTVLSGQQPEVAEARHKLEEALRVKRLSVLAFLRTVPTQHDELVGLVEQNQTTVRIPWQQSSTPDHVASGSGGMGYLPLLVTEQKQRQIDPS